jgi:hypothetical protein
VIVNKTVRNCTYKHGQSLHADRIINNDNFKNNQIYIESHFEILFFLSIVDNLRRQRLIKFNYNFDASHVPF